MAKAAPKPPKAAPGTAVTQYDEEIARLRQQAVDQEANTGGGSWFKTKGGILKFGDNPLPNNEVAAIVVDSILENQFYIEKYDPEDPAPPDCYAFGRREEAMVPHEKAGDKQADACKGCPKNEWASAEKGKGKACRNVRRLALLACGTISKDGRFEPYSADQLSSGKIAFMKVPPTSIVAYANYVKQVSGAFNLPPSLVFTKIKITPHEKKQFEMSFECLGEVDKSLFGPLLAKNKEATLQIEQPYQEAEGGGGKGAKKPPAKARKYR